MIALLFSFTLFLFFGCVGFATLTLFSQLRPLQAALVGPAFGICVITLPVFFLSRFGLPVGSFAQWVAVVLGVISLAILTVKRPKLPLKATLALFVVLVAALFLVGRPMLSFGFEWTSYANDDMANYCLSAARFLDNGYLTPPRLDNFLGGEDYSQAYWSMQFRGIRSGPDLMLAFVWGMVKIDALRVFMPTICAMELALASAAAGIATGFTKENRAPIITIAILAVSPMASLGVLYQLFAQIGGVAILCAAVALLCQEPPRPSLRSWLGTGVVAVIVVSGLLVWYPESTPFLGVGVLLYLIVFTWQRPKAGLHLLAFYLSVAAAAVAILNTYALSALLFVLAQQVNVGFNAIDYVRMPFFLIPSGIPAFWGLIEMIDLPSEPYLSIAIVCGIVLFAILTLILIPQIKRVSAAAIFCAMMLVVAVVMEFRTADYGLFKLSMFLQPFVAAVIASAIILPGRIRWPLKLTLAAILIVANGFTQTDYVRASFGGATQSTLTELGSASQSKLYRQLSQLFNEARRQFPSGVMSDTPSPVVAKFQALYGRGEPVHFLSNDFFGSLMFAREKGALAELSERYALSKRTQAVADEIAERKEQNPYDFASLDNNAFLVPTDSAARMNLPLLVSNGEGTIFNGSANATSHDSDLRFGWAENLKNYLIFIPSALGNYYYGGSVGDTSFYQLENDPMFPGKIFSSIGRHSLFMVRQPTPLPRLVVEVTTTLAKQFDSELPHPSANGTNIPLVGRGSARAIVPITLAEINHLPYLSIDFGRDGKSFPPASRSWLMSMFGRNITLDARQIIGFGRDISLISEDQYRELKAPENIHVFPNDLGNPALEYSGIYEDSWISEHSYFLLQPQPTDRSIRVKGLVPLINDKAFNTKLTILVDGAEIATRELKLGYYDFHFPISGDAGRHKIELVWNNFQRLPGDDGRPTAGRVDFVGYSEEAP